MRRAYLAQTMPIRSAVRNFLPLPNAITLYCLKPGPKYNIGAKLRLKTKYFLETELSGCRCLSAYRRPSLETYLTGGAHFYAIKDATFNTSMKLGDGANNLRWKRTIRAYVYAFYQKSGVETAPVIARTQALRPQRLVLGVNFCLPRNASRDPTARYGAVKWRNCD